MAVARAVVLALAFLALEGCGRHGEPQPLLVGHLLVSDGADKLTGDQGQEAIALAVSESNQGESQGGSRPILVLHAAANMETLQPVTVRLLAVDRVAGLLGGGNVEQAERIGRAALSYSIPLVTPAGLPPEPLGENVFSVNASLAAYGACLARFARKEKIDRAIILVDSRQAGMGRLAAAFAEEFARAGGAPTRPQAYKDPAELGELVEQARRTHSGLLFHAGPPADLAKLRARLTGDLAGMKILSGGDGSQLAALQADRQAGEGTYLAVPYVVETGTPQNVRFLKHYEGQTHQAPDVHAALAYEAAGLMFEVLRRAASIDGAKVLAEFDHLEFTNGLTGPFTLSGTHTARRPLFIVRLKDGRAETVLRVEPENSGEAAGPSH
jgi:branched-chain amino acid transport system substrate-binding protein